MNAWRSLVLATLTGCTAASAPPPASVIPRVPTELQSCPATPAAVPVPKPPRTFEAVVTWANRTDERRAEATQALEVCRARLIDLLAWIDAQRAEGASPIRQH